jgi:hypothetical protein
MIATFGYKQNILKENTLHAPLFDLPIHPFITPPNSKLRHALLKLYQLFGLLLWQQQQQPCPHASCWIIQLKGQSFKKRKKKNRSSA